MSILVVAEHDQQQIKVPTRVALAAAAAIGGDVDVLVAGEDCQAAADAAAQIPGVSKVLSADAAIYGKQLAENVAPLIAEAAAGHSHVLSAHSTNGKNTMPRVAALLDVNMVSDIISVESEDTFKRPFYAGNAIATVKSSDAVKVITVRHTAFDAAPATSTVMSPPIACAAASTLSAVSYTHLTLPTTPYV